MPKFIIERDIPGLGSMTEAELKTVCQKSCEVLRKLGPDIQWQQSYVTPDKLYCVYIAPSAQLIEEHARLGEFPCNRVSLVKQIIDPTSAE